MRNFTNEIDNALDVLQELHSRKFQKKNLLDGNRIIYLQISLFKIPHIKGRKRKFLKLHHSLYGEDPDICLFVPNRQSKLDYKISTDELIELTINYYTDFLEKHKIQGIKTIMPIKQLRSEYGVYEMRRKLVSAFDLFLCKTSLLYNSRFLASLGKIFMNAKKEPLGLSFPSHDCEYDPSFNENIKKLIFSSSFWIKPNSDNYCIPIGTTSSSNIQLKENLEFVLKQIGSENIIPGGFENIKNIYLWPSQSKTIPIYICSTLPKNIPRPVVQSKPRELKNAIGKISTLPKKKVIVKTNGQIIILKSKRKVTHSDTSKNEEITEESDKDDDDFDDDDDGHDDDDDDDNDVKKEIEDEILKKRKLLSEESDIEEDEEIEERERKLLNRHQELLEENNESIQKQKKIFQEKKVAKLRKKVPKIK